LVSQTAAGTTRIHIAVANDVRKTLIASGNGSGALRLSEYSAVLSAEDAQAIIAIRSVSAGALTGQHGVSGMTDPSHAIEQRPFEQCELLIRRPDTGRAGVRLRLLLARATTRSLTTVNYMSGGPSRSARHTVHASPLGTTWSVTSSPNR
jgi:hypothetical protein